MSWGYYLGCTWLTLVCFWEAKCTIIAKSDITICENTAKDPLNVLHNKRCEKKMVVLAEVASGQGETERLHATIKKVRDTVVDEDARLYNPFVITLSMSPIRLVYPIYYRGTINNKPYEEMVPIEKYGCTADEHPCGAYYDGWGRMIWDSWGFCCECQRKGMYATTKLYNFHLSLNNYFRGQIDCDKYLSSGHCMRFDELWYDAHEIDVFTFDFTIWVKAYDQVERIENNKTIVDWVDGGEIELSPSKSGGVGKHGRIVAKYIGKMKAGKEYPRLQDHYLMTPNPKYMEYGLKYHPQLKHGYEDYLIIPMSQVQLSGNSPKCDVIGVSFTAFAQQSTFHHMDGYGCYQKEGTCLRNQIQDYFIEDSMRRENGERTKYFPETYGKITGLKERTGSRDRVVEFESEEASSVMVYLEISADDLVLVYNRAGGVIVKAFAEGFESQSRNGLATVVVQNTGFVTADFYVSLEYCSNGINAGNEKRASINPQTNHEFRFTLESYLRAGGAFSCTANLYDARRASIDTSTISINTTSTCVCIVRCGCSCTDQENFVCVKESNVTFDQGKPPTYTDFMDSISGTLGVIFETVGDVVSGAFSVVKGIWGFIPHLDKIWSYLTILAIIVILVIVRVLFSFVPTGVFKILAKKTIKAMKSPDRPPPAPTVVVIQKDNDSEEDEDKKTQEFLGASAESGEQRKITDFIFEFCFFFIMPFMLLYKGLKVLWPKTLGPCFSANLEWLRKQLSRLSKSLYRGIKDKLLNKQRKDIPEYESRNNYNIYESVGDENESDDSESDGEESESHYDGRFVSIVNKTMNTMWKYTLGPAYRWLNKQFYKENGQNIENNVKESEDNEVFSDGGDEENVDSNIKSGEKMVSSLQKQMSHVEKDSGLPDDAERGTDEICDNERLNIENGTMVQHYGTRRNTTEGDVIGNDGEGSSVIVSSVPRSNLIGSNDSASYVSGSYINTSDMDGRDVTESVGVRGDVTRSDVAESDDAGGYESGNNIRNTSTSGTGDNEDK